MSQGRKVIVLTGANSGLGYETLKLLIQHSTPYHFILAVRNIPATEKAVLALTIPPQHKIEISKLDLSSFTSIKSFAQGLLTRDSTLPLNILILNAATIKSTFNSFISRIIFVNSSLHKQSEEHKNFESLDVKNLNDSKGYDGLLFYRHSKLVQMLFFNQLNKLLEREEKEKVSLIAIEPGFMPQTDLSRESAIYIKLLMKYILPLAPFARTPEQGGTVIVYASTSPELEKQSGLYINKCCKVDKASEDSYKEDLQKTWWNISCDLTGLLEKKLL
ncbi:12926_t:CDS:2 [Funneliformis geosporum]|uniref:12926_t:CDS:1 n=1 Tax=Funneliformis geosporum TaxID=1117311 RepID=A0A9W4STH6_9GLOM|nr:12926_t:CDS:2 [Funneliformis geosporum]